MAVRKASEMAVVKHPLVLFVATSILMSWAFWSPILGSHVGLSPQEIEITSIGGFILYLVAMTSMWIAALPLVAAHQGIQGVKGFDRVVGPGRTTDLPGGPARAFSRGRVLCAAGGKGGLIVNWRAVMTIVRKDLTVISRSKAVVIPLIVVPVVIFVVLPGLVTLIPYLGSPSGTSLARLGDFVTQMPTGLQSTLAGYNDTQKLVILTLVYFLAPMYLIVPLVMVTVISADSFAGEKERKTLEALLYAPVTDRKLLVGKILSA